MKFKLAPEVLMVFVLFIVVIFIANYGSCRREPVASNSREGTFANYREGFAKNKEEKEKEGFATLLSPASTSPDTSFIDVVGGLPSSVECIGNSFGYTKGAGGVCFDDQTKKLLLSRGGQGGSS